MSVHRPDSDMSRLNAAPSRAWIRVNAHTARVLSTANRLFKSSAGAFDIRCGGALVDWNYLPAPHRTRDCVSTNGAGSCPVEIRGLAVRRTGPSVLDLGGIAKGYAVDRAVASLRRCGIPSGFVNAGGDVRAFGPDRWPVALRDPRAPGRFVSTLTLKNRALATSGVYYSKKRIKRRWVSAIVDVRSGSPYLKNQSVSVISNTCMIADAMTKVLAIGGGF